MEEAFKIQEVFGGMITNVPTICDELSIEQETTHKALDFLREKGYILGWYLNGSSIWIEKVA